MSMPAQQPPRHRQIAIRALIWGLIGVIYVPLLVALQRLFTVLGLATWAYIPAAALASAAGAAVYGARQIAIAASLIGVITATFSMLTIPDGGQLWQLASLGFGIGLLAGVVMRFPTRCTTHVFGKTTAGLITGASCGLVLSISEQLSGWYFPLVSSVAFLVSVNGILYVATVRYWVAHLSCTNQGSCLLRQSLIIGTISLLTASSVWIVAGATINHHVDDELTLALLRVPNEIPPALIAGALAGAVTGALLEIFQFRWVHDV
jgi:uncharacterized membrane protein